MARSQYQKKAVRKSQLACPLCSGELNIKFNGFTCYGAVNGPYIKGNVVLECSDHKCPYRHSTNFRGNQEKVLHGIEAQIVSLMKKLPAFGPWEKFEISEKEKRKCRKS